MVHVYFKVFVVSVGLLYGVFLVTDNRGALLAVVDLSSLLELNKERFGELTEDRLHHVLFGKSPCVHFSVGNITELRFLSENYVIVSEESFGLESVGQVVLLSFNSVIKNMGLDYLEPYSNFTSLNEVHLFDTRLVRDDSLRRLVNSTIKVDDQLVDESSLTLLEEVGERALKLLELESLQN
jgi:hypothetical protein